MALTMNNNPMDRTELVQRLRSLVDEARQYPAQHPRRQKALTQAARIPPNVLWRERSPHYNDALQQTFEHFCRNVDRYDPERGSVVTWLNSFLRWRLIDLSKPSREIPFSQFIAHEGDNPPFLDIPAPIGDPPSSILDAVRDWAATDSTGELKRVHMRKYPQITAQLLILRRLPPETSWKTLSETLGIKIPALAAFYQRHCLPHLREFGKTQGYL